MTLAAPVLRSSADMAELRRMVAQRAGLPSLLDRIEDVFARQTDAAALGAWASASLRLLNVNAGTACLGAYWRACLECAGRLPVAQLAEAGMLLAEICREAGAKPAQAAAERLPAAALLASGSLALWLHGLVKLARVAPGTISPIVENTAAILGGTGAQGFDDFIAAGLRASGRDARKQIAFFSLADPRARHLIARAGGATAFSDVERGLKAYATALWGGVPDLRGVPAGDGPPMRRSNLAGHVIRLPEIYPGVSAEDAPAVYRAAVAHAGAHIAFGGPRFPLGKYKPLAIALISVIEDARVETLAIRSMPGLRRLWLPFHTARPTEGMSNAASLMARLARALIDPACDDGDYWVAKGRRLFAEAAPRMNDPAISHELGQILGRDLGQMRIGLNARDYVVEPVYRDDTLGLWDFGDRADAPPTEIDLPVDASRRDQREEELGPENRDAPPERQDVGRARTAPAGDRAPVIAIYPEWDRAAGLERPDWTSVREVETAAANCRAFDTELERAAPLRANILRLVKAAKLGRPTRLRRQAEGPELDLDAALDAAILLRGKLMPDERVFRTSAQLTRDLGVLILVDVSRSTGDRTPSGPSILDVERLAVGLLSEALEALGDPFAVRAFTSSGRDDVRVMRLKDFGTRYDAAARARLAGLTPGLSTRLGAAIRHAGAEMTALRTHRKLVLVLTDGEPSDVDVPDPLDLVADARHAILGLKSAGVDVFGVTLGGAEGAGDAVFGRARHMPVRRIADLPARLSDLYFRLARR
jgi:hypothetical protein